MSLHSIFFLGRISAVFVLCEQNTTQGHLPKNLAPLTPCWQGQEPCPGVTALASALGTRPLGSQPSAQGEPRGNCMCLVGGGSLRPGGRQK